MLNTCSTGAEEAASAINTSLLAIGWRVRGNGPQRSSKTEVCCWFLPVLVLPNRKVSQMTGDRLSAMAVS